MGISSIFFEGNFKSINITYAKVRNYNNACKKTE